MKKFLLCLVALALTLHPFRAHSGFYPPSAEVYTVKTEHFYIHYPKEVAPVAADLVDIVERVHARLSVKLKWSPWGRTHIVLVDTTDKANGLATVIPTNGLLLYVTPPDADSSLDNYKKYLELLFTHEYTHILHIDQHFRWADPPHWVLGKIVAPNGLTPGWMREGIATYEETVETGRGRANFSYTDMVVRTSIYEKNFPKIDQIAGLGIDWPGSESQYLYGAAFWKWLAEKYGEEKIQKYMETYAGGLWLFSLNNKAKRVYGKTFYKLWKEFEGDLIERYSLLREELERDGTTPFEKLVSDKDLVSYPTPHPTGIGYAYVRVGNDEGSKIVVERGEGKGPFSLHRLANGQLAFSRDGGGLVAYATLSAIEKYRSYSDVNVYDFKTGKTVRLYEKGKTKESLRASDPDFSPSDGGKRWIVLVRTDLGTDNLYLYDYTEKKGTFLTDVPRYTQFSNPRFSPDGQTIVVSRRDHGGNRDIVLYSKSGKELKKITNDEANDQHPIWSPDRKSIYFGSDRNGISNIYRYDLKKGGTVRVTNVLSGVYQPQITPDGKSLYVKYYTSRGTDLYQVPVSQLGHFVTPVIPATSGGLKRGSSVGSLEQEKSKKITGSPDSGSLPQEVTRGRDDMPGAKKYSAFPQILVPRYLVPTFATLDDGYLFGLSTGRFDSMYRHNWNVYANYRSDAQYVGAGASYTYLRYNPSVTVGFFRYSLNWGDLFGIGENFFEQRHQGYVAASTFIKNHSLAMSYFFEQRDNVSDIPAGFALANLDSYAGVRFFYGYGRYKMFPHSISQEDGPSFRLVFDLTDSILGSAEVNEQVTLTGDFRYYFEMPWSDHHVFGLRTAAGWVWGDQEFAGSFRFGGPFGEGALAGYSSRLFPFRGLPGVTFAGDRVLLFSGEYRLPIADVQRGIGTLPFFLKKIHLALFSDFGDSWIRNGKDNVGFFDDFFLSVGTELKGDFILGYGMPVTGRLGYAIILLNRDQIAGLTDSLFGQDIRNGTFYLQFGTSF